jgi:hypothetical protein
VNQLDALMAAVEPDLRSMQVTYRLLEEKAAALRELDSQVLEMLLDEEDAELDTEMAVAEDYQAKFLERKLAFESLQTANDNGPSGVSKQNSRKFKLPKLEFRKLGGDLKEWPLTKRIVLAVAQRVFDPVGFLWPKTLYAKLLLQRAWKSKMDWDSELEEDLKECFLTFLTWWRGLEALKELKIPRWMVGGLGYSLHVFCDASVDSYAAAVFLRAENTEGVTVQLMQAKCRVAPLNKPTVPRLELLAACIGACLVQSVIEPLKWDQVPVLYGRILQPCWRGFCEMNSGIFLSKTESSKSEN